MTHSPIHMTNSLVIQEDASFEIDNYQIKVLSYLGSWAFGIDYFKVNIKPTDTRTTTNRLGLLRVGSIEGGLSRELQLREKLGPYAMIAELLASTIQESVVVPTSPSSLDRERETQKQEKIQFPEEKPKTSEDKSLTSGDEPQSSEEEVQVTTDRTDVSPAGEATPTDESESKVSEEDTAQPNLSSQTLENTSETCQEAEIESDYLEEEYYPEQEISPDSSSKKLILLTYLPDSQFTLETWLQKEHSYEDCLSTIIPICQCFYYLSQRHWDFVDVIPQLIEIGKPITFFDLTKAYPLDEQLSCGWAGDYCAFELASSHSIQESMSSYTVGALLYQAIHQQLPQQNLNIEIKPIPHIYQLLKICLSPDPEERFSLSQLLSLLIEVRKSLNTTQIQWEVASQSTVGLSTSRLKNEDSYGVRQQQLSNSETMILGAVADGMGGMSQGELASKLAIETVLEEPIPSEFKTLKQQTDWLVSLFQKANKSVTNAVRNGGTTLSLVLAIGRKLMVAHVGDSRIYLIRKEKICQLSEDHSLVAMLLASGKISYEESINHPDSNVLTKSLGSTPRLGEGYVQNLGHFNQELSLTLEDSDILLICSDGVWSLVAAGKLAKIFENNQIDNQHLQASVNEVIEKVLEEGASDNATILALKCSLKTIQKESS